MFNVAQIKLWDEIKKKKEEYDTYHIYDWAPVSLENFPYVQVSYYEKDFLSNVISSHSLKIMGCEHPKFIAAQTGKGKSTLVLNKLLPIAMEENKKVLYLCNRSALAIKTQNDAIENELNKEVFIDKYNTKVKNLKNFFSPDGLKQVVNFGYIDIMLYQNFIKYKDNVNVSDYSFIVADEIHMITSDATFINYTDEILKSIVDIFAETRRIYLTATPEECLDFVYYEETKRNNEMMPYNNTFLDILVMQEDYHYIIPNFFSTTEQLIEIVKENPKDVWLIFVNDKSTGNQLQDSFIQNGLITMFFTSESDKKSSEFKSLLLDEKLPVQIAIATKVLDVGINIKQKGVKIAVMDFDPVEIKQMLGRKRLTSPDEQVYAYFKIPSKKELSSRIRSINKRILDINENLQAINNDKYLDNISNPFFIKGKSVCYNRLCLSKLSFELKHAEYLNEYLSEKSNDDDRSESYSKLLLSNFNKIRYDKNSYLFVSKTKLLVDLLECTLNTHLDKESFSAFAEKFKSIMGETRSRPRESFPGVAHINEIIKEYGYFIESIGSPVQYEIKKSDTNERIRKE